MKRTKKSLTIALVIATLSGVLMALAGSQGSVMVGAWPVFALCCGFAFALNWFAFIPANWAQTERYYDFTGSATYIGMIVLAAVLSLPSDPRATIVTVLVLIWAIRLGTFLFVRIRQDGRDDRFDEIKVNPLRFLFAWTVQALWVVMTAACALAIVTTQNEQPLGLIGQLGIVMWVVGFLIEVIADSQKRVFKKNPANEGRFIRSGLWAWSQHPNYFGEILLWTGIAVMAIPVLEGWQYVTLLSPVFVTLLLTKLSGIPLLRAKAQERWGEDDEYQSYRANTSTMIPMPPKS